jgi:hypothetical protein
MVLSWFSLSVISTHSDRFRKISLNDTWTYFERHNKKKTRGRERGYERCLGKPMLASNWGKHHKGQIPVLMHLQNVLSFVFN